MTSYIEITDGETDPGAPGTSELWKKWRDNPIAMAEGATGAPLIRAAGFVPHGWQKFDDGGDAVLWDYASDGAVASVETPQFEDGYEYLINCHNLRGSVTGDLYIDIFAQTSASYLTSVLTANLYNIGAGWGLFSIPVPSLVKTLHAVYCPFGFYDYSGAWSIRPGEVGAKYTATPQTIGKARIRASAGNLNQGTISLYKRPGILT